jgi:serine/threonine protein kinase
VVEENTSPLNVRDPIVHLLWKIAGSTHVFPQYYKLDPIRYELSSMVERRIGKVCKGRDFDVCVNVVTDTRRLSVRLMQCMFRHNAELLSQLAYNHLTIWARSPCPNIVPLYGVFYDSANEIPHLSLVSPYFTNGTLHEYAPRLPQESRILLVNLSFPVISACFIIF